MLFWTCMASHTITMNSDSSFLFEAWKTLTHDDYLNWALWPKPFKIFSFYVSRKNVKRVRNDTRLCKWWQHFNFWVNCSFKPPISKRPAKTHSSDCSIVWGWQDLRAFGPFILICTLLDWQSEKKDTCKCMTTCITHKLTVTFKVEIVVAEVVKCDGRKDRSVAAACRFTEPLPHAESLGE